MSPRFFFVITLLVLFLAACGGEAVTQTKLVPPPSPGGRMCIDQCGQARDYCVEKCDLVQRTCINKVQTQAIQDYEKYAREQFIAHQPEELNARDFERDAKCDPQSCHADCSRTYNKCYKNCGGTVVVQTSCQFLCF